MIHAQQDKDFLQSMNTDLNRTEQKQDLEYFLSKIKTTAATIREKQA